MASPATPPPRHYFPSVTPLAQAPAAPPGVAPAASPPSNGALVAPPAAPPQARKVARLVTAEAAQSNLKLAADGQLPCLQLQESDKKDKGQGKSRSIPPLVMIGAWILSVAVTAAIVLLTSSGDDATVTTDAKRDALAVIEKDFFGDPARGELLPHQRLLREAREARARGDLKAERQYYRKVLDLLHTESPSATAGKTSRNRLEKGITGSRENDRILEQKILTILGD
jgi:hypothetical protein